MLLILGYLSASAQENDKNYVQFSGKTVTEDLNGDVVNLPYVTIGIEGTSRGTYSELDGFFSIVAAKGDVIKFSRVGYQDAEITVPDTLTTVFYSWIQIMSQDSVLLPEAVIYPWPDREHYKIEFLALDLNDELDVRARENIKGEVMARLIETLPADGAESYELEFRRNLDEYKYSGQLKPANYANPLAWAEFIKAWKRGDFKSKKKKKKK